MQDSLEHATLLPPPKRYQRSGHRGASTAQTTVTAATRSEAFTLPVDLDGQDKISRLRESTKNRRQYNRIVGLEIQQDLELLRATLQDLDFDLLFLIIAAGQESRSRHNAAG